MATVEDRAGGEAAQPAVVDLSESVPMQPGDRLLSAREGEELVLVVLGQHADALLRTARRHSISFDDAQDAYQRGLEIFLKHARRLDPGRAPNWLHTVIKHEAMAVRRTRQLDVPAEEFDFDAREAADQPSLDEQVLRVDRITRSAEALKQLKPQELRALWLKAEGHSYQEIAQQCDWTYTKVNRCVTEGRKAFLARYASLESGEECERWLPAISALVDGEANAQDAVALRAHLRNCPGCRATLRTLHESGPPLHAVLPIALVVGEQAAAQGDATMNLVLRVYEAIVGGAHERATASVIRMQTVVEGATATKVAAVAASAAAVAGGGTVAVERVQREPQRPVAKEQSVAGSAAAPSAAGGTRVIQASSTAAVQRVAAASTFAATKVRTSQRAAARARAADRAAARRRAARRTAAARASSATPRRSLPTGVSSRSTRRQRRQRLSRAAPRPRPGTRRAAGRRQAVGRAVHRPVRSSGRDRDRRVAVSPGVCRMCDVSRRASDTV